MKKLLIILIAIALFSDCKKPKLARPAQIVVRCDFCEVSGIVTTKGKLPVTFTTKIANLDYFPGTKITIELTQKVKYEAFVTINELDHKGLGSYVIDYKSFYDALAYQYAYIF